jgi:hypothetical protein
MTSKKLAAVRGMNDLLPAEAPIWEWFEARVGDWVRSYGYQLLRTPVVEHTELFVRGIGEVTDIVEKEMYSFEDRLNGENLTLRPEFTAGTVRAVHTTSLRGPRRVWSPARCSSRTTAARALSSVSSAMSRRWFVDRHRRRRSDARAAVEILHRARPTRDQRPAGRRTRSQCADRALRAQARLDADARRHAHEPAAHPRYEELAGISTRPPRITTSRNGRCALRLQRLLAAAGVGFTINPGWCAASTTTT